MSEFNPIELITPVIAVCWTFFIIAILCELGERVTQQFNAFNEQVIQCEWHLFSLDLQRMLLIFMCDSQQPAFVRGFANIVCTRDSFKKVNFQ